MKILHYFLLISLSILLWTCSSPTVPSRIDDYFLEANNTFNLDTIQAPKEPLAASFLNSFELNNEEYSARLLPVGINEQYHLCYTQLYPEKCNYQTTTIAPDFPCFYFPNVYCNDTSRKAKALIIFQNKTGNTIELSARVYFQNTSYWYPIHKRLNITSDKVLENYYGQSKQVTFTAKPFEELKISVPYRIGPNAQGSKNEHPFRDPARVGYYEFALLVEKTTEEKFSFNLRAQNPFVIFRKAPENIAYVRPEHFKMVLLNETFGGTNDLRKDHIYLVKDRVNKELIVGFDGKFKDVISEKWTTHDFFEGFINDAPFTEIDYGNRIENVIIDTTGITLTNPASKPSGIKQKTWGEFTFGPFFKYGTIKFEAKFSQLRNRNYKTPTGVIHNAWLYQLDYPAPDPNSPYKHLTDVWGRQPFEIDIEIWSNIEYEDSWDSSAAIFFSIVDYMKDDKVIVKPNEAKKINGYKLERLEPIQVGVKSAKLYPRFFEKFHNYEISWHPEYVSFKIDGKEKARITNKAAAIPDNIMYLWIGSPMYQDGTWYDQRKVPMLETDKHSFIRSIVIE